MINIQKNVDLQPFNTMALPCVAEFYCEAESTEQVMLALEWARARKLPVHALGGGSNTLLHQTIKGLVLKPLIYGIEKLDTESVIASGGDGNIKSSSSVFVRSGAGEAWHDLVMKSVSLGFSGIENLALIPGNVGAAPIQNIGAYGVELKDVFHSLEAVEIKTGKKVSFTLGECEFAYRDSVFKQRFKHQYIIAAVTFQLSKTLVPHIEYPALNARVKSRPASALTAKSIAEAVIDIRNSKLPLPEVIPNAGSFFKNPIVDESKASEILQRFPACPVYDVGEGKKKLAAGWLIEQCGWKGKEAFGARVHDLQALVLTNPNRLSVDAILKLATALTADVKRSFGVELEREPQFLSD